ncbi:MAG: hypothetical protein IT563_16675 [Alphaproteobacteria bacterium]|nr:hypothetical protein [Alphaproteobacteria bacterium]
MTTTRTRLAALSLCLVAGLAALPAMAESDNHVIPPSPADAPAMNRGPMPGYVQDYGYDPATGALTFYSPAQVPQYQDQPLYQYPYQDARQYRRQNQYQAAPPAPVVYAPIVLNENQIEMSLARQGYHRIKDVTFERGHYKARARDGENRAVTLVVSAETGRVLDVRYVR